MATTTVSKQPQLTSSSPEEERLRRNTDCVYFLASPLTCKKGGECEYRHSEAARINPKDCYYWLNGNCSMPRCAYRHPPLDGLVLPQVVNFAGTFRPSVAFRPHVPLGAQYAPKQAVPCLYFQMGQCLKGDRCTFLHGQTPPSIKSQQVSVPAAAASAAPAVMKTFSGLEKCTQPKMNFQINTSKMSLAPRQQPLVGTAAPKVKVVRPLEATTGVKCFPPSDSFFEEVPKHKVSTFATFDSGNLRGSAARLHRSSSMDDYNSQNGRNIDDSLRESSPGFDVLVDDKLRDDEYYPTEDQFGGSLVDFDGGHLDDYNSVPRADADKFRNRRSYDSYDGHHDSFAREQHGASTDGSLDESAHCDQRGSCNARCSDFPRNSDLRHRLSKQRKGNGLRSVVNPDFNSDAHSEDRMYQSSGRYTRRSSVRESSIGGRLQGRIRLPRTFPPASGGNMYSERDHERQRNLGRTSPSRAQASYNQGRLHDRLNGRVQVESNGDRSFRGQRKDSPLGNSSDFAGPKRLSELRGHSQSDIKQQLTCQQSVSGGKLRDAALPSSLGTDSSLSFAAPKPLSEILKRKRDAGVKSGDKEATLQFESNIKLTAETRKQIALSSEPEQTQEVENINSSTPEGGECKVEFLNKKTRIFGNDEEQHEIKDRLPGGNVEEEESEEECAQEDGGYEYGHDDTDCNNLNEEGDADHEGDIMDEDDGDDFAKKLGVSI